MLTYKINNTLIKISDESFIEQSFKDYFTNILITRLLPKEKLLKYLKKLNITYMDAHNYSKIYGYYDEEEVVENELRANVAVINGEIILKIYVDFYSLYYKKFGEESLIKNLNELCSHELVHIIHSLINTRVLRTQDYKDRLNRMYKAKYPQFESTENEITLDYLMDLIIIFQDHLIVEGFAMLSQKMRIGEVQFTDEFFEANYKEAKKIAKQCNDVFEDLRNTDDKDSFLKKAGKFYFSEPFLTLKYAIGFHVVFSLIYLSEEDFEKAEDAIMSEFFESLGREKLKKLVKEYEILMLKKGKKPIIGSSDESIINMTLIQEMWKNKFRLFE